MNKALELTNLSLSNVRTIFLCVLSILIQTSPQYFEEYYQNENKILFIMQLTQFPRIFRFAFILINFGVLLWSTGKLFINKKFSPFFTLFQYLLGPVQIYLSLKQINQGQQNNSISQLTFGWISLGLTGISLFIISYSFNFRYKSGNFHTINSLSPAYVTLTLLPMMFSSLFSLTQFDYKVGLAILFLLNGTKSIIMITRIAYEDSLMEYLAILREISSWISFISLILTQLYQINSNFLLWFNSLFVIYLSFNINPQMVSMIEYKYRKSLMNTKRIIISELSLVNNGKFSYSEDQLIETFLSIFYLLKKQGKQMNNTGFKVTFSQTFFSEICQLLELFCFHQKVSIQHAVFRYASEGFQQINTQRKCQVIWKTLGKLKQVKLSQYSRFRTFLIHSFPLLDIKTNHKLLYLYYINMQNEEKSMLESIQFAMTYDYLTQKISIEHESHAKNHNKQSEIVNRIRQENNFAQNYCQVGDKNCSHRMKYCFAYEKQSFKESDFQFYYEQTLLQDKISEEFQKIFETERNIIKLVSKNQNNTQILRILIKKNEQKTKLSDSISNLKNSHLLKALLYRLLFQFYVHNTPNIAIHNLKKNNIQDLLHKNNKNQDIYFKRSVSTLNFKTSRLNQIEKGGDSMILLISGIKNFGSIHHSCSNFKQKLQVGRQIDRNGNQKYIEKLSIYDIMLPIWSQKHYTKTKDCNVFDPPSCHKGTRFFIISYVEKYVFQINFEIHYIVRNNQDLLFGLQIEFKEIDKICIYKKNLKVFQSLSNKNADSRITKFVKKKVSTEDQSLKQHDNCIKTQEKIFGEDYTILKRYKNASSSKTPHKNINKNPEPSLCLAQQQTQQQNQSHESFQKFKSSEIRASTFANHTKSHKHLENEMKMSEYSNKVFFHKNKFWFWTVIHWGIPPFLLVSSLFLKYWSSTQELINNGLYDMQVNSYRNFLLVDSQLLNNLWYINELYHNLNRDRFEKNLIMNGLLQDIRDLKVQVQNRQKALDILLVENSMLLDFVFTSPQSNPLSQSFYYGSLNYDIYAEEYLSIMNFNSTQSYPPQNLWKNLNDKLNNLNVNRFFHRFKHRYEEYFETSQFHGIITQLKQFQVLTYQQSKNFFFIVLVVLLLVAFGPAVQFTVAYIDLMYHVHKTVLQCVNFPQIILKKIKKKIHQASVLIQNCKENNPDNIFSNFHTIKQLSQDNKFPFSEKQNGPRVNFGTIRFLTKEKMYDSKPKIVPKLALELFVFFIIVACCQILLLLLIKSISSEISLIEEFSKSSNILGGASALSNQINTEFIYARTDMSRKQYLFQKIDQFWRVQKIKNLHIIQPHQQRFINLAYSPICSLPIEINPKTCIQLKEIANLSFAETVSSNIKSFRSLQFHFLDKHNILTFDHFQFHMNKISTTLSILNRFTKEVLKLGHYNYHQHKDDPDLYFDLLILEMGVIIILFNWFTYYELYAKFKIYYQEAFSIIPMQEMTELPNFNFYVNQGLQIRLNYASGFTKTSQNN